MASWVSAAMRRAGGVVGITIASIRNEGLAAPGALRLRIAPLSSTAVTHNAADGTERREARPQYPARGQRRRRDSSNHRSSKEPMNDSTSSRDFKPDLVRGYIGAEQLSASEGNRLTLRKVRSAFATHAHDCGGSAVQIASLTEKIRYMTEHLRAHHKDKASMRGLVAMLERRKKLLKYLRRSDGDAYGEVIYRLGLKDRSFVEDKYKTSKK